MPYATLQDLVVRFGQEELIQLTDRQGLGAIDGNAVQAALVDADATIEGYLSQRYALPVTPVPVLLRRLACDIARFFLSGEAASEAVRQANTDALRMLRDLSSGAAALAGAAPADPGATPAAGGGQVMVSAPPRRFDQCRLADYLG